MEVENAIGESNVEMARQSVAGEITRRKKTASGNDNEPITLEELQILHADLESLKEMNVDDVGFVPNESFSVQAVNLKERVRLIKNAVACGLEPSLAMAYALEKDNDPQEKKEIRTLLEEVEKLRAKGVVINVIVTPGVSPRELKAVLQKAVEKGRKELAAKEEMPKTKINKEEDNDTAALLAGAIVVGMAGSATPKPKKKAKEQKEGQEEQEESGEPEGEINEPHKRLLRLPENVEVASAFPTANRPNYSGLLPETVASQPLQGPQPQNPSKKRRHDDSVAPEPTD